MRDNCFPRPRFLAFSLSRFLAFSLSRFLAFSLSRFLACFRSPLLLFSFCLFTSSHQSMLAACSIADSASFVLQGLVKKYPGKKLGKKSEAGQPYPPYRQCYSLIFLFISTHPGRVIAACKIADCTPLCLFSKSKARNTLGKTRKKS